MKRTIQATLIVGVLIAIIIILAINTASYTRPNLLSNPQFNADFVKSGDGWHKLDPAFETGITIRNDTDGAYAHIDTSGINDGDRNPFLNHGIAQSVEFKANSEKTVVLSGRIALETEGAVALVLLKTYDRKSHIRTESYRYGGEPGVWQDFSITLVADSYITVVEVALGVHGTGKARFGDFDLVFGKPRGSAFANAVLQCAIALFALAVGLALVGLLFAKKSEK